MKTAMAILWFVTMWLVMVNGQQSTVSTKPPNIVFFLTDDQDLVLGGMDPMQKTTNLIGKQGIIFENAFVSVPVCCPSRASILTGKFLHNHGAINNSLEGGCSSLTWQREQEPQAFPVYLQQQGYTTFYAGKYLNKYGKADAGGTAHVPPGWDSWIGLVGNSQYYNYKLSVNGTTESHGDDYLQDYLTDLINRRGLEFLEQQHETSAPFFMMLSVPACHTPFPPAPHYAHYYSQDQAPRDHGSFNTKATNKHWLVEQAIVPIPNDTMGIIDNYYRSRLRTLLSVDDLVEDVYNQLRAQNLLDNTYLFFTSDHGYHLGQFGLPYDKRQPYDFDVRVPMMVKGPGIPPGLVSKESPMNIDLGPTFISLAGGSIPSQMDGQSMEALWGPGDRGRGYRDNVLMEYSGEMGKNLKGCPQLEGQGVASCKGDVHCVCQDAGNNTWSCLRTTAVEKGKIYKYCEFKDQDHFVELYELTSDPWELRNVAQSVAPAVLSSLRNTLHSLTACTGQSCRHAQVQP